MATRDSDTAEAERPTWEDHGGTFSGDTCRALTDDEANCWNIDCSRLESDECLGRSIERHSTLFGTGVEIQTLSQRIADLQRRDPSDSISCRGSSRRLFGRCGAVVLKIQGVGRRQREGRLDRPITDLFRRICRPASLRPLKCAPGAGGNTA
jgi:hypothetical protein